MLNNILRLANPDVSIYRTFPFYRLRDALQERSVTLVKPALWDDPFENILASCGVSYASEGKVKQFFYDAIRKPVFAQCWTLSGESDALWRIYSKVDKDPLTGRTKSAEYEGIKVRTTARKLLAALWHACPTIATECCFLGQVEYFPEEVVLRKVANQILCAGKNAFDGGIGHARALLFKREPFDHEEEVRLIYVEQRADFAKANIYPIAIDPNSLFDEIILDPRLHKDDVMDRTSELRSLGYDGRVMQSDLYQRILLDINIS